MKPRIPKLQLDRARDMRREQTVAEDIIWRALRNRQFGVKFRRQVPVGGFIADFACVEAKVIVEVDGPSHETEASVARDAWRTSCLREMGWRLVRIPNELATGGGDLALAPIRAALKGLDDAARVLLPRAGEGLAPRHAPERPMEPARRRAR